MPPPDAHVVVKMQMAAAPPPSGNTDADDDLAERDWAGLDTGAKVISLADAGLRDFLFHGGDDGAAHGQTGADQLFGGHDADQRVGSGGADGQSGHDGDDALFDQADQDRLFGGTADDGPSGGDGEDRLFGGDGAAQPEVDAASNRTSGGQAADSFIFDDGSGDRMIVDFDDGVDAIEFMVESFGFDDLEILRDGTDAVTDHGGGGVRLLEADNSSTTIDDFTFADTG